MSNIVVIDNASNEQGTDEYLSNLINRGIHVCQRMQREPSLEFAKAMNLGYEVALQKKAKFIAMLPADMQFVARNKWLNRFVNVMLSNPQIGSLILDAQRRVTHSSHKMISLSSDYFHDTERYKVAPWGTMTRMEDLALAYPWDSDCHAPALSNLELKTVEHINQQIISNKLNKICVVPKIPVAITIWNDEGHQAKVRLNRRIGKYLPAHNHHQYYEIKDYTQLIQEFENEKQPISIEQIAKPISWKAPIDANGNWIKKSLNLDTESEFDSQII
jgi:hypothetical protein